MGRTYREAGVDIDEARRAVELIGQAAASTATPAVLGGIGGFGSLFRLRHRRRTHSRSWSPRPMASAPS